MVTQTHKEKERLQRRTSGRAGFQEGDMESSESVFVLEREGTSCFSPLSIREMGSDPRGCPYPPPYPHQAAQKC